MRKSVGPVTVAVLMLLTFGSCVNEDTAEVVEFLDGRFLVIRPADWRLIPGLNEEADLEMGNPRTEAYCMILSEPKMDFDDDLSLRDFSDLTRGLMMEALENGSEEGPERITANDQSAIRYVMNGTVDRVRVKYWHVSVDSGDYFHQLIFWSLPSRFDEHVGDFEAVLNSFGAGSGSE